MNAQIELGGDKIMDGPEPDPSMDRFLREEEAFRRRAEGLHAANKAALLAVLSNAGVTSVTVSFVGYGDEGQVQGIRAVAGEVESARPTTPLESQSPPFYSDAGTSETDRCPTPSSRSATASFGKPTWAGKTTRAPSVR